MTSKKQKRSVRVLQVICQEWLHTKTLNTQDVAVMTVVMYMMCFVWSDAVNAGTGQVSVDLLSDPNCWSNKCRMLDILVRLQVRCIGRSRFSEDVTKQRLNLGVTSFLFSCLPACETSRSLCRKSDFQWFTLKVNGKDREICIAPNCKKLIAQELKPHEELEFSKLIY